jgi:glycosyltransferase involved in cell wall biosynthesis
MAMKISVITVCFNSAATITDTLRSVAGQTHPNVEHVIVDGGSRDDTIKLTKVLGRSGIVISSEPDKGIYDAMNKGLRLATGDVIGFLNADDMYAADDVLAKISALMQQSELDALYGDTEFVRPSAATGPTVSGRTVSLGAGCRRTLRFSSRGGSLIASVDSRSIIELLVILN